MSQIEKPRLDADAGETAPADSPESTSTSSSAPAPKYAFFSELASAINAGQSRSIILSGNVQDLFYSDGKDGERGRYVPLVNYLCGKCDVPGILVLVYELNGPIRTLSPEVRETLKRGWVAWRSGDDAEDAVLKALTDRRKALERDQLEAEFEANLVQAIGKPTLSLEFLRQLTICSRSRGPSGRPYIDENLLVVIEAADFLLPPGGGDISQLSTADRHRVSIAHDWFSDPGFLAGEDSVILLAESRSLIHPRVARLPQVMNVEVPSPDETARLHAIEHFSSPGEVTLGRSAPPPKLWAGTAELARFTAGLSIHALRQLLVRSAHEGEVVTQADVVGKVEEFIRNQIGEDVVEFKKPSHTLDDVVGFSKLKDFIQTELLPRFRESGAAALPGAAVAGAIGSGKTFIFEAVATSLDLPVLVLKNIRSQWFGQTDVIFERLRRALEALGKVLIFVDEADTQFGGIGEETHSTERRLTGKIQQMMSDTRLRGKVIWLLMTARIHLLSPDIRRPGRVGDLIIPVLDPQGDDRRAFLLWLATGAGGLDLTSDAALDRLDELTPEYSAAAFASLRSHLKAKSKIETLTLEKVAAIVEDHIPPAIQKTRRYQTLQALVNCTRRSLLPNPKADDAVRDAWEAEIRALEREGIR